MLSQDTLRAIGDLDRPQIERRVRRLYDHWSRGEIDAILAIMSADVQMGPRGQWAGAKGMSSGREAVEARLRKASGQIENIVSVLHEVVIDGERAVVHRTAVGRRRDNQRRYQCDFIDFFRFRDGLIVEFSEYPDHAWVEAEAAT